MAPAASWEMAVAYHRRTKHQPQRYALSPGYLDWANQPNPFRRFVGAHETHLPLSAGLVTAAFTDLAVPGRIPPSALDSESLSAFFQLSLGLSAWKRAGASRWALRCNPSSGNLHPTEGYLLARGFPGVPNGVHHYAPHDHLLEHRCVADLPLPERTFAVGLSSVHWREAWKYGERAFRYCQHDVGHALAALRYAAAALGWNAALLDAPGDADISAVLGLDRTADFLNAEPEHPDVLVLVSTGAVCALDADSCVGAARSGEWAGAANRLSAEVRPWPIIEEVAVAAAKPRTIPVPSAFVPLPTVREDVSARAAEVIVQRRSAQRFDGRTGLSHAEFLWMVEAMAPRSGAPFDMLPWPPLIHPVMMVHRVEDVAPGLYAVVREPSAKPALEAAMRPDFLWRPIHEASGAALFLLAEGDARAASRAISCSQDIASDGAFSLGMLADFAPVLEERGAWWYRRMFWETGVLGQALYLEAEALGARGTGIGCYLDDLFHGLLGLEGSAFQSMYHFTVGFPLEDPRLETLPPYAHLA